MTTWQKIEKWFAIHTLVFLAIIGSVGVYWVLFDDPEIYSNVKTTLIQKDYRAGDTVHIEREYCYLQDYQGVIQRRIVNHYVYQMTETPTGSYLGCGKRIFSFEVPLYFTPGEYTYKTNITFKINPLKDKTYKLEDVKFNIIN